MANGVNLWSARFGGGVEYAGCDAHSDLIVAGVFDTLDFGAGHPAYSADGPQDLFFAKLDRADGAHEWSRVLDAGKHPNGLHGGSMSVYDMEVGRRDLLFVGDFGLPHDLGDGRVTTPQGTGDGFVSRLSTDDGSTSMVRSFGGHSSVRSTGVAQTREGTVYVVGDFLDEANLGGFDVVAQGGADGYVLRLAGE